jgi:hypothetical protein
LKDRVTYKKGTGGYQMELPINTSTLILSCGDITKESTDAIVNATRRLSRNEY